MVKYFIFVFCFIFSISSIAKEAVNNVCNVRGYEIIFPYEKGVNEIKQKFSNSPSVITEGELENFCFISFTPFSYGKIIS